MTTVSMMDAPTTSWAGTDHLGRPVGMLAEEVRAEGWGWLEVQLGSCALDTRRYRLEASIERDPAPDEAELLRQLQARHARLVAAYNLNEASSDPLNDSYCAQEQRLGSAIDQIEDRIEAAHLTLGAWTAEQMARLGAVMCVDPSGAVVVHRGLSRRLGPGPTCDSFQPQPQPQPHHVFSDSLLRDLSAHRTAALQATLMQNTHVALVTLVHRLAETLFERHGRGNDVVKLRIQPTGDATLSEDATGYDESPAGWILHCAEAVWAERLPGTSEAVFTWLLAQNQATLLALLAYCTARSLHAVSGEERTWDHSDAIASALALDMADWWVPTSENYLGHVTRRQAAQAVHEATGLDCRVQLAEMKRSAALLHCAKQLEGTRWLPTPLRSLAPTGCALDELA